MHFGVTMPDTLVKSAASQGGALLAVSDQDGLYGAVRHLRACVATGIRPALGADRAVHDDEQHPLGQVVVPGPVSPAAWHQPPR